MLRHNIFMILSQKILNDTLLPVLNIYLLVTTSNNLLYKIYYDNVINIAFLI